MCCATTLMGQLTLISEQPRAVVAAAPLALNETKVAPSCDERARLPFADHALGFAASH